ncbi:MAG TPA: hypothetical protein VNS32_03935 [Flavisolibacter sp.]|nr:hypothetical protein [Flavisolibacter sp.]
MHPWYKNTKGQIALVIASVVMLLLLIWSQLFRELSQDREDTLQRALQRNANLAVSWEQYTIRTLQNADEVLRLASWEYTQQGKAINLRQLYQQGVINASCFSGLVILNEKGQVVTSDMAHIPDSGMNLSDRPHFTFHKTHLDELYISEPFQSRTIHGTVIVLSRRINKPDGSFGGTVALQLLPSVFTRFYARADMRTNEILSLIAPDGITYARRTGNKESFGENICKSPLFHKIQHAPTGQYLAPDAIHGIPTYFSYRKLEHYPVIATVGSSQADIFSSYHVRARQKYVYGLGITILLVLFCMVICITLVNR